MIDLTILLEPWAIFSIMTIILVVAILIVASIRKKLVEKKEIITEADPMFSIRRELEKIRIARISPEEKLEHINKLVHYYLEEVHSMPRGIEYIEAINILLRKNRGEEAAFLDELTKVLYSGEKVSEEKLKEITYGLGHLAEKEGRKSFLQEQLNKGLLKYTETKEEEKTIKLKHVTAKPHNKVKESPTHKKVHSIDSLDRIHHKIKNLKKNHKHLR